MRYTIARGNIWGDCYGLVTDFVLGEIFLCLPFVFGIKTKGKIKFKNVCYPMLI